MDRASPGTVLYAAAVGGLTGAPWMRPVFRPSAAISTNTAHHHRRRRPLSFKSQPSVVTNLTIKSSVIDCAVYLTSALLILQPD